MFPEHEIDQQKSMVLAQGQMSPDQRFGRCTVVAPDDLCLSEVAARYFWGLSIVLQPYEPKSDDAGVTRKRSSGLKLS